MHQLAGVNTCKFWQCTIRNRDHISTIYSLPIVVLSIAMSLVFNLNDFNVQSVWLWMPISMSLPEVKYLPLLRVFTQRKKSPYPMALQMPKDRDFIYVYICKTTKWLPKLHVSSRIPCSTRQTTLHRLYIQPMPTWYWCGSWTWATDFHFSWCTSPSQSRGSNTRR